MDRGGRIAACEAGPAAARITEVAQMASGVHARTIAAAGWGGLLPSRLSFVISKQRCSHTCTEQSARRRFVSSIWPSERLDTDADLQNLLACGNHRQAAHAPDDPARRCFHNFLDRTEYICDGKQPIARLDMVVQVDCEVN